MGSGQSLIKSGLIFWTIWLALSGCDCKTGYEKRKAMHENDALYYTVRAGDTPCSESLKIDVEGFATFLSTNNFQPGTIPEIGSYALKLENGVADDIWRTVETINFAEIDTSDALPDEGDGTRTITIVRENLAVSKLVGKRDAAPSGFRELEEKFLIVVNQVRRHPVSALRMEVSFAQNKIQRGEMLQIDLILSNPGKKPILCANPVYIENLGIGFLELDGLRSDLPLLELRDQHHRSEQLNHNRFSGFTPEPLKEQEAVELHPGEAIKATLRVSINWPAGEYKTRLSYACRTNMIGDKRVFEGEIDSQQIPLKVLER